MNYNLEQYREKREKVLGARHGTISFGRLSSFFATGIVLLVAIVVIPQMIDFFQNRNLDDVIYRLKNKSSWSTATPMTLEKIPGVVNVIRDEKNHRLILTFNRTRTQPTEITKILKQQKIDVVQLNVIDHNQRLASMKKEAEFEAL